MKKQLNIVIALSFLLILSNCSGSKPTTPGSIHGKQIEFFVQKSIDADITRHKQTYLYQFHENSTYKVTTNGSAVHAGGFSYKVLSKTKARIVCTYSTNNQLASYEMILEFANPTDGTWESSYNNDTIGAEAGTFLFIS